MLGRLVDPFKLLLHGGHVDLVVVQRMQRGRRRAGHPGSVGAGLGVGDLLLQHRRHQVRHGPHALADLRPAPQPASQAHQHVVSLVGLDPGAGLHVAFAQHRAGLHGGVHLVASAVQEAGIDEGHAAGGRGDAGLQVEAGAALFVHDAELDGAVRQTQQLLDPAEQFAGEGHLGRPVHLRLDDVDAAFSTVADGARGALQVVQGDGGGHVGVEDALWNLVQCLVCARVQHGGVGHQVADISQEHQASTVQDELAGAVGRAVAAVGVQTPGEGLAALADRFGQRAFEDAEPVSVANDLVIGVDRGDRVFEVEDGRQRRLQHHVADPGQVVGADGRVAVEADVDVQAVVPKQHRRRRGGVPLEAHQCPGHGQHCGRARALQHRQLASVDAVAGRPGVAGAIGQRQRLVEKAACVGDHTGAADRVVGTGTLPAVGLRHGIGAIQGVIERSPARIGRVQRVARVQERHHQLGPGHQGQFGVDLSGRDRHMLRGRQQVANALEQRSVCHCHCRVRHRARMRPVPVVDLALQPVALGQQAGVAGSHVGHDGVEARPEARRVDARTRQDFVLDEALQRGGNVQSMVLRAHGAEMVDRVRSEEPSAPAQREGKKSRTSRRLLPVRVGSVSSCSSGMSARLTHSVL